MMTKIVFPRVVWLGLLLAAVTLPAQTPPPAPPIVAQFREFFTPAIGEWRCHIREWDGKGDAPVWQDHQLRRFEWQLMNEFVSETALAFGGRSQRWMPMGMHLFGAERTRGTVIETGFWAGMSPDGFRVEFSFDATGRVLTGTMHIAGPDGKPEARRCEFSWEGGDKFFFRVYRAKADGSGEYLHEELAYARGAYPPPALKPGN